MQDIHAWLQSSQNYNEGVLLYNKYGKSIFFKTLFSTGATPYNIEKLEAELISLAPTPPAIKQQTEKPITEKPPIDLPPQKPTANNHAIYIALQEDNKTKYRQLERNMIELDLQKNEQILFTTAKQILKLHKAIQSNYVLIDYYEEHGFFPQDEAPQAPKTETAQLLMQSISKAKTRLKSGKCRNIEQTLQLIAEKTEKLNQLKRKDKL